jgi:integrase
LRKSEILGLKWEDVDFRSDNIHLLDSKSGKGRTVPMNEEVRSLMNGLTRSRFIGEYVFCKQDGKPYSNIKKTYHRARRKAGLDDVRFHDLRHTTGSWLAQQGTDLLTISEVLGHATMAMTRRYAHLSPSMKRRAMDRLGKEVVTGMVTNESDERI